jgi:hypothetical protein
MSFESLLAALTPANDRVPVAIEIDSTFDGDGKQRLAKLALNAVLLQELRAALSGSGSVTNDGMVFPILSSRLTGEDVTFFRHHQNRSHLIREAIEGETVLNGRSPASEYVCVIRQVRSGFRTVVAIDAALLIADPSTRAARLHSDEALSLLFDTVTSVAPGTPISMDAIIAYLDGAHSQTATADGAARKLS